MSIIKHIEERKIRLTRIFQKHGIEDIQVSAQRMPVPGLQGDEAHMFEVYKEEMSIQPGDVIRLDDFRDWLDYMEQEPDGDALFLTLSRELTDAEFEKVHLDLARFIRRSTSHGLEFRKPGQQYLIHLHGT